MKKKTVIVTGGSRGIGFATSKAFLEEGANVIVTASCQENADKAVEKLKALYPEAEIDAVAPNLNDYEDVKAVFKNVAEKYGTIDVLINNAGASESTAFEDYTEDLYDKIMDLNVKGTFNCTKAVVDYMIKQGEGVILNTSSMVSIYGQKKGIAYPTSKAAVNGMTKSLARELGQYGIRVNAVLPGIIETDMMMAVPKEVIQPLIDEIPLKKLGKPEDIANAFVFLASDKASYITGVTLSVDGAGRS